MLNSLNLVLLKMTSPGVPDTYQGNETWEYSLVDPDNRKPIDYENRKYLLRSVQAGMQKNPREYLLQMLQSPEDGRIKLFVTSTLLHFRREHPELFSKGTYIPLKVIGEKQNHVIAYAWQFAGQVSITIATRFFSSILQKNSIMIEADAWKHTKVLLPKELNMTAYCDLFTQNLMDIEVIEEIPQLSLEKVLDVMPLAFLIGQ